jgi:hypothetical protein
MGFQFKLSLECYIFIPSQVTYLFIYIFSELQFSKPVVFDLGYAYPWGYTKTSKGVRKIKKK